MGEVWLFWGGIKQKWRVGVGGGGEYRKIGHKCVEIMTLDWIGLSSFTSPPTQYRLYGRRFLQVKRPNQQYQSTEGTYDLTWFIQHRRCIGPHVDAMSVCLELMLQRLPRLIPFFEDPYSLHLSSLSLVYQVFSWILQLPTGELASEFVLHPFLRHDLAIAIFFPESRSLEVFALFFSVSPRLSI